MQQQSSLGTPSIVPNGGKRIEGAEVLLFYSLFRALTFNARIHLVADPSGVLCLALLPQLMRPILPFGCHQLSVKQKNWPHTAKYWQLK